MNLGINQETCAPHIIDKHKKQKARHPSECRFPFEPMEHFRKLAGIDFSLFNLVVEAAVNHKQLAIDIATRLGWWFKARVEPNKVKGASNPGNSSNQMREAQQIFDPDFKARHGFPVNRKWFTVGTKT